MAQVAEPALARRPRWSLPAARCTVGTLPWDAWQRPGRRTLAGERQRLRPGAGG